MISLTVNRNCFFSFRSTNSFWYNFFFLCNHTASILVRCNINTSICIHIATTIRRIFSSFRFYSLFRVLKRLLIIIILIQVWITYFISKANLEKIIGSHTFRIIHWLIFWFILFFFDRFLWNYLLLIIVTSINPTIVVYAGPIGTKMFWCQFIIIVVIRFSKFGKHTECISVLDRR